MPLHTQSTQQPLKPQQTLDTTDPIAPLVPGTDTTAPEGAMNLLSHSSSPNLAQHDGAGIGEDKIKVILGQIEKVTVYSSDTPNFH